MRRRGALATLLVPGLLLAACGLGRDSAPPPGRLDATPGSVYTTAAPDFDPLKGARAYFGTLGSAVYRIEVPRHWNRELVLWAHAVHGFSKELTVDSPPPALRQLLVDQGYAWAASSFSENGYAPGVGLNDTLALKQKFARQVGRPRRTYVAGASMGGNVVTLALENFPAEFDGGLALCGAVAGEEFVDYLLAWTMAAEFIAGTPLPLGDGSAAVEATLQDTILPALGPVDAPTVAGKAFATVVRDMTGGPRPFFTDGYRASYASNFGLLAGDPGRILPATRAATNEGVDYRAGPGLGFDGDLINRSVRRLPPDPAVRDAARHPENAPTTARIRAPLLTLHETGDLIVPVSMEQSYRRKADAAGTGSLLVQRLIRDGGHCTFSDQEITRAWRDLVSWVATGKRPAGDDVLGDLADAGRTFTDPLRPSDAGAR